MTVQNKHVKRLIKINKLFTLLTCQRAHVYRALTQSKEDNFTVFFTLWL